MIILTGGVKLENNKLLPISIIILALGIVISVVFIVRNLPRSINVTTEYVPDNAGVFSLDEVTHYLELSEEQVIRIINIEKQMFEESGVFTGEMFPYFIVDGEYYFHKDKLDSWLNEVSVEHKEYNTTEGLMID